VARPSSIGRLPPEIREAIGRLRDGGQTIDEILAHLRLLDAPISRSALGRHIQRVDQLGARLRQSRHMAEALARQLGDKPGDQVARVNIELLHSFLADAFAAASEGETDAGKGVLLALQNPKGAALFAEAVERLTKASRNNAAFVADVEKRAVARAQKEAAERVETLLKPAAGMSAELKRQIKAEIFGVQPAPPPGATA